MLYWKERPQGEIERMEDGILCTNCINGLEMVMNAAKERDGREAIHICRYVQKIKEISFK